MNRDRTSRARALIVDDEENTRSTLSVLLREEGLEPLEARDGNSALKLIRQGKVDLALLDERIPGANGVTLLDKARRLAPGVPIILMTGSDSITSAVEAMKNGACDYLTKPVDHEELLDAIRRALKKSSSLEITPSSSSQDVQEALLTALGTSEQMSKVVSETRLVAPTNFTVLVTGETGTGKEMVAQALHQMSRRGGGPFVPVDCGGIPPTLIESELFGHERGAYTGAVRSQPGKFEVACGGTLFLDEISNLPLSVQPKLLRALQERKIWRVGGRKPIDVSIRVVAATNQELEALVQAGRFRMDLYHRVNEFRITVPPLRERREDILFYAKNFLRRAKVELGKDVRGFSDTALDLLLSYHWPGNVRELRNVTRRAVLRCDNYIGLEHLGISWEPAKGDGPHVDAGNKSDGNTPLRDIVRHTVKQVEREVIARVLRRTGGNKAQAARILQVDYKTIHSKVRKYDISA